MPLFSLFYELKYIPHTFYLLKEKRALNVALFALMSDNKKGTTEVIPKNKKNENCPIGLRDCKDNEFF